MGLSKQAVSDFKSAYFKRYGKVISDTEAQEKGLELLTFFKIIYKPIRTSSNNDWKQIGGKNE
ncbi:hypothetical protein A2011_00120 [candidate division CPR3 bacterium GWE2_35_7]|uniref:Uncharacterized protein n=1 Tax=candidate division CPR3 bacterium GW2011_GWF2_35_18 TaxID=1618350 RepID=A0A0G0BKI8_UNCC3|nr:MAG: hypothetical protein UR67_C0002G0139 [candidate division CPR3 bacterium GW2011_GWF2_35_18]KKP86259.1 MAG: hypothetical protein UR87_C0024G0003 [candidate division CPR3 bacterium GW2011_GWE2_35_7]OGB65404.1 MAG: hypothetical protein A2250_00490 [candidate division CPR3 bacterium RIFOXYA2_FULL_35_13]OGB76853.1 MAG: hypothetical protein A2476_04260 [candidate division CPR3 bacterium RIFOXYC2_FULL_35_7]OGB79109.1 MAG: hypothetical protein A2296_01270 [candidate division CPR3 bacterium RIFOX